MNKKELAMIAASFGLLLVIVFLALAMLDTGKPTRPEAREARNRNNHHPIGSLITGDPSAAEVAEDAPLVSGRGRLDVSVGSDDRNRFLDPSAPLIESDQVDFGEEAASGVGRFGNDSDE